MITDLMFEQRYKHFLTVRDEWLNLAHKLAIYHGQTPAGQKVRPVGLTSNERLIARAQHLSAEWQSFCDFASERKTAGIKTCSPALYNHVPVVIGGFNSFSINSYEATSVSKLYREDILNKATNRLNRALRDRKNDEILITNLKKDIELFSQYPEGTLFRQRAAGYRDIFIDFFHAPYKSEDDEENISFITPPAAERIRVAAPGVIVDGRSMKDISAWKINDDINAQDYHSIYDALRPVPCSFISGAELYLLEDVISAKEQRAKDIARPYPGTRGRPTQQRAQA